jgi:diguanylate cyclase (GGDEF)-like protein
VYFFVVSFNKLFSDVVVVALLSRLRVLHDREKSYARVDFLTGALNYRGFYESLGQEMERHRRDASAFTIAYLDCDNFKEVNDHYGHKTGDLLLTTVVSAMKRCLRRTDIAARLGGDEFAIILLKTDTAGARKIIPNLHHELDELMTKRNWPVTFSIGVGVFPRIPRTEDEVISFADHVMYRSKAAGKNNVIYDEFQGGAPSDVVRTVQRRVSPGAAHVDSV